MPSSRVVAGPETKQKVKVPVAVSRPPAAATNAATSTSEEMEDAALKIQLMVRGRAARKKFERRTHIPWAGMTVDRKLAKEILPELTQEKNAALLGTIFLGADQAGELEFVVFMEHAEQRMPRLFLAEQLQLIGHDMGGRRHDGMIAYADEVLNRPGETRASAEERLANVKKGKFDHLFATLELAETYQEFERTRTPMQMIVNLGSVSEWPGRGVRARACACVPCSGATLGG